MKRSSSEDGVESSGPGVAVIRTGGCLCGRLRYQVSGTLAPVVNCHCRFCRRVHGAPFTTLAFLAASAFEWSTSSEPASDFVTEAGHIRRFCGECSSPICNFAADGVDVASLVVGSLADEFQLAPWFHVNLESKSPWFEIGDDLPRFDQWPGPTELLDLARKHETRLPDALGRSSG